MDDILLSERSRSIITSPLPLWIIEYAFTKRMMDVLEVLGAPPWLEGDWGSLTLKDPCSIRVVAAEAWTVIRTRDIQHFERVLEVLNVIQSLLPHLVPPIKHMKIMFGLKTLVIMWMFCTDQSISSINDKILKFFPDSLPQYHRSSRRHIELMQNAQREFRNFAQSLAKNPEMRKTYIRDGMEEQYGEHYAIKLEERLLHYLKVMDQALSQPTYIDQVLEQSLPLGGKEELLQQLLTCDSLSPAVALKRLLRCAVASHTSCDNTETSKPLCVVVRRSSNITEQSKSSLLDKDENTLLQTYNIYLIGEMKRLNQKPRLQLDLDVTPCDLGGECPLMAESGIIGEDERDSTENLCTRHGKKMKSILQECSEELRCRDGEDILIQEECTPALPRTPVLQVTPYTQTSLQDSPSTNISMSSHQYSSTDFNDGQQLLPSQASLFHLVTSSAAPAQTNSSTSSSQELNFASKFISAQEISGSPTPSVVNSSPVSSVLPFSSWGSPSPFPVNQVTHISAGHHVLPSSTADPYSLMLTQNNSPSESISHQLYSPSLSSSAPVKTLTPSQIAAQVSDPLREAVHEGAISEPTSTLEGKLRLSRETQSFLLLCKWLQPQVKLYRLNQHDCNRAKDQFTDEERLDEEGEEEDSFDVNSLYSDSESDKQDSDDPDYRPSKRLKFW